MNCTQAEGMIQDYLEHSMSTADVEIFLEHVEHCSSCYKELEISFFVRKVVEQLDDADGSDDLIDIHAMLEKELQRSHRSIRMKRLEQILFVLGLGAGLCLVVLFAVFWLTGVF